MGSGRGYPWVQNPSPRREPPLPTPKDGEAESLLIADYGNLRLDIAAVEQLMGSDNGLTDDELKRLDKSIVLMKTGAKMLKKVLRARGYRQLKPASMRSTVD